MPEHEFKAAFLEHGPELCQNRSGLQVVTHSPVGTNVK